MPVTYAIGPWLLRLERETEKPILVYPSGYDSRLCDVLGLAARLADADTERVQPRPKIRD
jgi:hypothetical protein